MIEWPPKTADELEIWMLEEMPVLRGKPPDVIGRVEELRDKIERAEAEVHSPVNAHYSQVNIARTSTSDPTYRMAAKHIVGIEEMRAEYDREAPRLRGYELAKVTLPKMQLRIVTLRYEEFLAPTEVYAALSLPSTTYYRQHRKAIEKMLRIISKVGGNREENGTESGG